MLLVPGEQSAYLQIPASQTLADPWVTAGLAAVLREYTGLTGSQARRQAEALRQAAQAGSPTCEQVGGSAALTGAA